MKTIFKFSDHTSLSQDLIACLPLWKGNLMKAFMATCILTLIVLSLPCRFSYAQFSTKGSYNEYIEYAAQEERKNAWRRYHKGLEYATQGKFKEAKKEFERSLKIDEFYTSAIESLRAIKNVITQKIERETAIHLFKGISFADIAKQDQAIEEFTKAIEISPRFVDAYLFRGLSYDVRRQYDQAIKEFTKAIEINPRNAKAYNTRGFTYRKMDLYDLAIKDYTKSIEINPSDVTTYINRGLVYDNKGQRDQAVKDYTKAIEINPICRGMVEALLSD